MRLGDRLAGGGKLNQGPIDALLLVLDVRADIGDVLVDLGDGGDKSCDRFAVTIRFASVAGRCDARGVQHQH
ncbi:hypothetical protein MCHLDSM_01535 [Mycolicibacterium chlorophenolicum]|uniref:Uncharacterized protein n=1 Tax=Mycolicibacterium chlorophenolicum TaxID=37916 RepID=A0A0J6WEE2_9MYCO|nr:hypothetical protein MCHLDSM_01535 [Mycolicibacterium chlorophenolicum]